MGRRIRVATGALSNTIFAGVLLKNGMWGATKQDVTMDCLNAVADHIEAYGNPVIVSHENGEPIYKLTFKRMSK